jgi:hypothetical protein
MESTGFPNCIQISQDTADLLVAAGKLGWITPRADLINAKGKGLMQTYMLEMAKKTTESSNGGDSIVDSTDFSDGKMELTETDDYLQGSPEPLLTTKKNGRLVEWIAEVLLVYLKEMTERRNLNKRWKAKPSPEVSIKSSQFVIDEVKEIISLPIITDEVVNNEAFNPTFDIDPAIGEQLRHYLARIAAMYPENPCKYQ